MNPILRRATVADVPLLAKVFARAFADDPGMSWVLPDEKTRVERLTRFFAHGMVGMIRTSARQVFTTTDVVGGATWAPPGAWQLPARKMLPAVPAMIRAIGLGAFVRISRNEQYLAARHPRQPHWYLDGVAIDPDSQGQGIGTSVLRHVLDKCDMDRVAAYLETHNEANLAYYTHHGFVAVEEVDIPLRGPHVWLMWREPQPPDGVGPTTPAVT